MLRPWTAHTVHILCTHRAPTSQPVLLSLLPTPQICSGPGPYPGPLVLVHTLGFPDPQYPSGWSHAQVHSWPESPAGWVRRHLRSSTSMQALTSLLGWSLGQTPSLAPAQPLPQSPLCWTQHGAHARCPWAESHSAGPGTWAPSGVGSVRESANIGNSKQGLWYAPSAPGRPRACSAANHLPQPGGGHAPLIPVSWKPKQEEHGVQASLYNLADPALRAEPCLGIFNRHKALNSIPSIAKKGK